MDDCNPVVTAAAAMATTRAAPCGQESHERFPPNESILVVLSHNYTRLRPESLFIIEQNLFQLEEMSSSMRQITSQEFYLFHDDGSGYVSAGIVNPLLAKKAGPNCMFRFVVVPGAERNTTPILPKRSKKDYVEPLKVVGHVAIQYMNKTGKRSYISCRRVFRSVPLPKVKRGGCLAEYRPKIGRYETFQVLYRACSDTFAFRSHNNRYLHYNKTYASVAFKKRRRGGAKTAQWRVIPVANPTTPLPVGTRRGWNSLARNIGGDSLKVGGKITLNVAGAGIAFEVLEMVGGFEVLVKFGAQVFEVFRQLDFGGVFNTNIIEGGGMGYNNGNSGEVGAGAGAINAEGRVSISLEEIYTRVLEELEEFRMGVAELEAAREIAATIAELRTDIAEEGMGKVLEGFVEEVAAEMAVYVSNLPNLTVELMGKTDPANWRPMDIVLAMQTGYFMHSYVKGKESNQELIVKVAMLTLGFAN